MMVVIRESADEDGGGMGEARLPEVQLGIGSETEWSPGNDCAPPPG